MDHDVRIALGARDDVTVRAASNVRGDAAALAEVLRRLHGGFIIGQAGHSLLPRDAPWFALVQTLECPLFIAR
jgi:hypothetical protein